VSINCGEILRYMKKEATDKGLAPPDLEEYKNKILKDKNPFS
jgi:hypothetical protein